MLVKYCNAECQKKHWATHKKPCKQRAAELRDEALFKDPPPKEDCPICFLPMPSRLISCVTLPPAIIMTVPINDFAIANEEFEKWSTRHYYSCCGKSICSGCVYSFRESGNDDNCPFCNSDRGKTVGDMIEEVRKRVAANDVGAICQLANYYYFGEHGLQQDHAKSTELSSRAAYLGSSQANFNLADLHYKGGDLKKAKFHNEAVAMAGHEVARYNLGNYEKELGNMERAVKHWTIAASAGNYTAMKNMLIAFNQGYVSRESIDSTLTAYNSSCVEMRSEARDAFINKVLTDIENEA
jgi:hypothetical protein